jgi:hypothetical protein
MAENFSRDAAMALFEYLEDLEEDCGEPQEFDRVAIRCGYSEYESAIRAAVDNGWKPMADTHDDDGNLRPSYEVEEENNQFALDWLRDRTSVIEFDGGIIIAD